MSDIDPEMAPLIGACIENEKMLLKKKCTIWLSSDTVQPTPLQISDIVLEASFPVFKSEFRETKTQRLERWGKEYKDIARRQETYVKNALALSFVDALLKDADWSTDTLHLLSSDIHDILTERIGYFQYQYVNVRCNIHGNKIIATIEYKLRESLVAHQLYISNKQ